MNTESVDAYLADGCGRCELYQTPQCKVLRWPDTLVALRELLQSTELVETMKWGAPCYTLDGKNVLMMSAYKDFASISFFKGSLLTDPDDRLVRPGPNSQAARLLKFTSADAVHGAREDVLRFVHQAIELEKAGAKVEFKKEPEPVPDELQAALDADEDLAAAFAALTPGRRRSHILHISGAKKAATRERRVQKCIPKIQAGKGFLDR